MIRFVALCAGIALFAGCATGEPDRKAEPAAGARTAESQETAKAHTGSPEVVARAVVTEIAGGKFDKAVSYFDATMKTKLPAEKLAATWEMLQKQAGAYRYLRDSRVEEHGELTIVYVGVRFEKTDLVAKVAITPALEVTGLFFVPDDKAMKAAADKAPPYADREAFTEVEVTIGKKPWQLPGTLTLPEGEGPFPAVILVHGSGPNDRDETIGANKPFRDLAWGLASKGIAVLRYDKRTRVYQAKLVDDKSFTVRQEVVLDAVAAAKLARRHEKIADDRVYVLGHSLGGMMAPQIARAAKGKLAGLIILAGPTRPLTELIVEQVHYMAMLDGQTTDLEEQAIAAMKEKVAKVKAMVAGKAAAGTEPVLGAPASYWRHLSRYKPVATAKKLRMPILILQGGRDYQVTEKDFAGWKAGLGRRKNVSFKLYPALNHLFVAGEGKSTPAEYTTAGHVDAQIIADIAAFIQK